MGDSLGDRMKRYEQVSRTTLLPHSYTVLRVDGRAFHSYLRGARKPFDYFFIDHMTQVGEHLCREVSGTVFAYGQSDEISLLLSDVEPQSQPWFGGVVQKMASVAASVATAALIGVRGPERSPHFDARVFTLPSSIEVGNYFIWRQRDAVRNSVSMAAQAKFSHNQLHGKSSSQMQEMLFAEHNINWSDYPDQARRGWVVTRSVRESEVSFTGRDGVASTGLAMRTVWQASPAPHFSWDLPGFLPTALHGAV